MPDDVIPATNIYDMRLTAHEDGWIYGVFCAERHDTNAPAGDLSSATATAAIARTKDLKTWERLPDLKSKSQQRNVVLHPEFVDGNMRSIPVHRMDSSMPVVVVVLAGHWWMILLMLK